MVKRARFTTLDITLTRESQKITTTFSRPVLPDVNIAVEMPSTPELKVGQDVSISFVMQRRDGTLIDTWDMPLKIGVQGGDAVLVPETLTFA